MINKISHLTPIELVEIVKIWFKANCEAHPFIPESYWNQNLDFVRAQLPKSELYVYRENNQIIGFMGMNDSYIAGIFITSSHRKQGIGQQFLNTAKQAHDTLSLSVYAKNQIAVNFYKKQGFQLLNEQIDATGELEFKLIWKK